MKLIVDAYNVLHAWRSGPMPEGSRELEALASMIGRSRYYVADSEIVCDGGPPLPRPRSLHAGVHFRFAGAGKDADSVIESLVRRYKGPSLHVVSSDRRVQRAGRKRRATVLSADAFLGLLVRDAGGRSTHAPATRLPKPGFAVRTPLHPRVVKDWASEFEISLDAAGPPSPDVVAGAGPGSGSRIGSERGSGRVKKKGGVGGGEGGRVSGEGGGGSEVVSDPVLRAALEHFRGRLRPEDLDMSRWLGEGGG